MTYQGKVNRENTMDTTTLSNILEKVNQMEDITSGVYVEFANAMRKYFDSKDDKVISKVIPCDKKMILCGENQTITITILQEVIYKGATLNTITYKLNNNDERTLNVPDFLDKLTHYYMLINPKQITIEVDEITIDINIYEYIKSLYKINNTNKAHDDDDDDDDDNDDDDDGNYSFRYIFGTLIGLMAP